MADGGLAAAAANCAEAIAVALWGHKFRRLIKTDKLESHRELRVIKFNQSWKPVDSLPSSTADGPVACGGSGVL